MALIRYDTGFDKRDKPLVMGRWTMHGYVWCHLSTGGTLSQYTTWTEAMNAAQREIRAKKMFAPLAAALKTLVPSA